MEKRNILKIGLFLGGISSEKEISLESARHIYNNLDEGKYEKIPIFVDGKNRLWQIEEGLLWMNTTADIEAQLRNQGQRIFYEDLKKKIDFAFLALHGKWGEDCFPGLLLILGIPNNSAGVLGGSLGMDKFAQKKVLEAVELNVPSYKDIRIQGYKDTLRKKKIVEEIEEGFEYPFIVKPSREGCSLAISKVTNKEEIKKAFDDAFRWDNLILVEEFIDGREITTTVLGNEESFALTPTETPHKKNFLTVEEKFLPGDATMITPPKLPQKDIEKIQKDCVMAYKALGQRVCARIDGIWKEGKFYILEPNAPPGMTPSTCVFHQAAEEGWSASDFFDKVIEFGMERGK